MIKLQGGKQMNHFISQKVLLIHSVWTLCSFDTFFKTLSLSCWFKLILSTGKLTVYKHNFAWTHCSNNISTWEMCKIMCVYSQTLLYCRFISTQKWKSRKDLPKLCKKTLQKTYPRLHERMSTMLWSLLKPEVVEQLLLKAIGVFSLVALYLLLDLTEQWIICLVRA